MQKQNLKEYVVSHLRLYCSEVYRNIYFQYNLIRANKTK